MKARVKSWKARKLSKRMLRNIENCYHTANTADREEGIYWYQTAHNDALAIARRHNVPVSQAAGVIAALSPGREWGMNLQDADELIRAFVAGQTLPMVGSYGKKNINKARAILRGADPLDVLPLTGPKTRAFYRLILDPADLRTVCVDRHAKAVSLNKLGSDVEHTNAVRHYEYEWYARHYQTMAERYDIAAHQLQAVCWVTWRRLGGDLSTEVPF